MLTLDGCSKAELRKIIDRLMLASSSTSFLVDRILSDLNREREDQKYRRANETLKTARRKLEEYKSLVSPYDGVPISEIPVGVIHESVELFEEYRAAEEEWFKLMGVKPKRQEKCV